MTSCRKQRAAIINKHPERHATCKNQRRVGKGNGRTWKMWRRWPPPRRTWHEHGTANVARRTWHEHGIAREHGTARTWHGANMARRTWHDEHGTNMAQHANMARHEQHGTARTSWHGTNIIARHMAMAAPARNSTTPFCASQRLVAACGFEEGRQTAVDKTTAPGGCVWL